MKPPAPRKPRAKGPGAKAKAPAKARSKPRKTSAKSPRKTAAKVPGKAPGTARAKAGTKAKTGVKAKAAAKPRVTRPRRAKSPLDKAKRTLALIEKLLDDQQAEDVVVVDLAGKTAIADYMVVANGRNPRHIGAMAQHLKEKLKGTIGVSPPIEGLGNADWVLVDAGDVIVHLFRPEVRTLYNLEKMWGSVPPEAGGAA